MLLAALALVFHGAVRLIAHPVATAAVGAHGHHAQGGHRHGGHHAPATVAQASQEAGTETALHVLHHTHLDCCTAVAAVVLPEAGAPEPPACIRSSGVAPGRSAALAGLVPEGPSKPPRTPYQG